MKLNRTYYLSDIAGRTLVCVIAGILLCLPACSDEGSSIPVADASVDLDGSPEQDAGNDTGSAQDAEPDVTVSEDAGPEAQFFGDFELRSLVVDDEIPQVAIFETHTGTNHGPDELVVEVCTWEATRDSDDSLIGSGTVAFCDDCNPLAPGGTATDSTKLEGLGPAENPGTTPATLTVTCLPTGLYADTDPSNNTLSESFNF